MLTPRETISFCLFLGCVQFPADSAPGVADRRVTSPFPAIPDVSVDPEARVEQSPSPSSHERGNLTNDRPNSPFPSIPDITQNSEMVQVDIESMHRNPHAEIDRASSPYPKIADVSLNPEIVEEDVTALRVGGAHEMRPENDSDSVCLEVKRGHETSSREEDLSRVGEVPARPFPTIPDPHQFQTDRSLDPNWKPFYVPKKSYAPVSLTEKKYPSVLNVPQSKTECETLDRPEFSFALADADCKMVERAYSEATSPGIRSLQSEIFESRGHFRASPSYPVFIPGGGKTNGELHNGTARDETEETPQHRDVTLPQLGKENEKETNAVPHLSEKINLSGIADEKTKKLLDTQKQCFAELVEIKESYKQADLNRSRRLVKQSQGGERMNGGKETGVTCNEGELNEGIVTVSKPETETNQRARNNEGNSERVSSYQSEVRNATSYVSKLENGLVEEQTKHSFDQIVISDDNDKTVVEKGSGFDETSRQGSGELNSTSSSSYSSDVVKKNAGVEKSTVSASDEKPKYRKPPETIIGARPLFGQLNINEEFKKAVDRRQSFKMKKGKDLVQNSKSTPNGEQNHKTISNESRKDASLLHSSAQNHVTNRKVAQSDFSKDEQLCSQYSTSETAEVTKLNVSETEEVERIYYQREHEYEVDYQSVEEQTVIPFTSSVKCYSKVNNPEVFGTSPKVTIEILPTQSYTYGSLEHDRVREVAREKHRKKNQLDVENFTSERKQFLYKPEAEVATEYGYDDELEEEYRKVPVKSLIRNFEQSSMPQMRVTQIRDPLPDVVEKLASPVARSPSHGNVQFCAGPGAQASERRFLDQAEEDFENLYYVANSNVESKVFYPEQNQRVFNHAESSSFKKYSQEFCASQKNNVEIFEENVMGT